MFIQTGSAERSHLLKVTQWINGRPMLGLSYWKIMHIFLCDFPYHLPPELQAMLLKLLDCQCESHCDLQAAEGKAEAEAGGS